MNRTAISKATGYRTILSAALLAATVAAHPAPPDAAARQGVDAGYRKMSAAIGKRDADALFAVFAPDFTNVDTKGNKGDVNQLKQGIRQVFSVAKSAKFTYAIQKLTTKGNTATATVKESMMLTIVNPNTKQQQSMNQQETDEDTWVSSPKGWLLKSSKTLTQKTTTSGGGAKPGR